MTIKHHQHVLDCLNGFDARGDSDVRVRGHRRDFSGFQSERKREKVRPWWRSFRVEKKGAVLLCSREIDEN
jgi:hypothetical protein